MSNDSSSRPQGGLPHGLFQKTLTGNSTIARKPSNLYSIPVTMNPQFAFGNSASLKSRVTPGSIRNRAFESSSSFTNRPRSQGSNRPRQKALANRSQETKPQSFASLIRQQQQMPQSRSNEAKPKAVLRSKSISMARNSSAEALFEPHQDKIAVANASDVVRFGESPKFPGVIIAYRTDRARMANPERLNLDRRNLSACPLLEGEHRLRLLNLQNNRISNIDNCYGLPNLIFLDLYNNQIQEISNLGVIPTLRVLMLGRNRILSMEGLEELHRLDVLDLHSNQITKISHLNHLTQLRVLNLAGNSLTEVDNLVGLKSLTEMNLRRNKIQRIKDMDKLGNLQTVFLNNNQIKSYDAIESVFGSSSIVDLSIDGNEICIDNDFRKLAIESIPTLCFLNLVKVTVDERKEANLVSRTTAEELKDKARVVDRDRAIEQVKEEWKRVESEQVEEQRAKFSEVEIIGEQRTLWIYGNSLNVLRRPSLQASVNRIVFCFIEMDKIRQEMEKKSINWLKQFARLTHLEFSANKIQWLEEINWFSHLGANITDIQIEHNPVNEIRFLNQYIARNFPAIQRVNGDSIRAAENQSQSARFLTSFNRQPSEATDFAVDYLDECYEKQMRQSIDVRNLFDKVVEKAIREAVSRADIS